jgi:hypothetical protein
VTDGAEVVELVVAVHLPRNDCERADDTAVVELVAAYRREIKVAGKGNGRDDFWRPMQ